MAERYYAPSAYSPLFIKAITDRFLIYFCQLLYADDYAADPQLALKRMIISDIGAGNTVIVGDSVEKYQDSFAELPFTGYNPDTMDEIAERVNTKAAVGTFFAEDLGFFVAAWPMKFQIQTVSFFGTAADYWRAYSIATLDKVTLTRWKAPLIVNGNTYEMTVTINMEISKGSYAGAFEEFLRQQDIWDLVINFTFDFVEFKVFDDAVANAGTEFAVYPIDELIAYLAKENQEGEEMSRGQLTVNDSTEPEVVSTTPVADATAIAVTDPVVIVFNVPMFIHSVRDSLSIIPAKAVDLVWSNGDKTLTIVPRGAGWNPATLYTIDLVAESSFGGPLEHPLDKDLVLKFTTA